MIASTNEVERGIDNLWRTGESDGLKQYPNYGQYIPKNWFKAFQHAFPYVWAHMKYWYMDRKDVPWDMFAPFVETYNATRRNLVRVLYLVLDESMSGWRPKSTKTGGLPNITFEPRKPVNLGTMIRNGVECRTGIFVHHDIVRGAEEQDTKKYVGEESSMPRKEPINVHVAEVLRQAEGAEVLEGGWVCGDAWFGSVNSCVELMKRKKIFSTFVVKQNLQYFPMQVLKAVLLARYPTRPAGHWVVMKAVISGVEVFALMYAWSNNGIAYFISSCGKTIRHECMYKSSYEDMFGNVESKEHPRPAILHMVYDFLPLIDEHNKARQNILALERCWLTKDCWFRLDTTFLGMAVVDMQRWDRSQRYGIDYCPSTQIFRDDDDNVEDDIAVKRMANLIAKGLLSPELKFRRSPNSGTSQSISPIRNVRTTSPHLSSVATPPNTNLDEPELRRIMVNGRLHNSNGKACQRYCFICCQYDPQNHNTQWKCPFCEMPLCRVSRNRAMSCLDEHLESHHEIIGCDHGTDPYRSFILPRQLIKYRLLSPRNGKTRKRDRVPNVDEDENKGNAEGKKRNRRKPRTGRRKKRKTS